jgi:predicted TIM-barrel fold metal-dependent hydrolase
MSKDFSYPVIDFHVHLYPELPLPEEVKKVRNVLRDMLEPISGWQHEVQTWMRKMPAGPRKILDELGTPSVLPHLLLESHYADLLQQMQQHSVEKAVVIPHPPLLTNDFVFYECRRAPEQLVTCTFIDPQTIKSKEDLAAFYNRGVRVFKINPIQSGVPAEAPYYEEFLEYLNQKKSIVILHTGNIYSRLFKSPDTGDVTHFAPWFERFTDIRFLLAHMNFHEPEKAMYYAEKHKNVYLFTSWQPASVILKATERVQAEKILFASDWPLLGNNIALQKARVLELLEKNELNEDEVKLIFYDNAKRLLTEQGV